MSRIPASAVNRRELLYGALAGGGLVAIGVAYSSHSAEKGQLDAAPGYGRPPYGSCGFGE